MKTRHRDTASHPRADAYRARGCRHSNPLVLPPDAVGLCERQKVSVAFTLLELLTVIAIIGILAAIALPSIKAYKPNYTASATRQLLDAIARGRQLALSQRTTVLMVFVPPDFWNDPNYNPLNLAQASRSTNLFNKQYIGYNYVTLRSLGDQPGRPTPRYLDNWRTLPEGSFIPTNKFDLPNKPVYIYTNGFIAYTVYPFPAINIVPFPSEQAAAVGNNPARWATVRYLAFDYLGRLVTLDPSTGETALSRDEIIPLAKGSMNFARDPVTKAPIPVRPSYTEDPPGNWTNAYTLVYVEALTGRAHVERQEIQ